MKEQQDAEPKQQDNRCKGSRSIGHVKSQCWKRKILRKKADMGKGAPAQESHTNTRLVSPATGCKKKKKTPLQQGLGTQN